MTRSISEIGEDGLIEYIFKAIHETQYDDAITEDLNDVSRDSILVCNTDMLVSTTDVPQQMNLIQAGRKAIIMAVSDLLVKGVQPSWATIALGLPKDLPFEGENGFTGLIEGLFEGCKEYGVRYRGGDLNTTKEIIISVTVSGYIQPAQYISRSGAKPDDDVYVNGIFGYTGVGLTMLLNQNIKTDGITADFINQSINSVLNAKVSGKEARYLSERGYASASCDSSDGLHRALQGIAKASGVGFKIDLDLFITPELQIFSRINQIPMEKLIVGAGEEWIHVFCVKNKCREIIQSDLGVNPDSLNENNKASGLSLIKIGTCTNEVGSIHYFYKGKELNINQNTLGYVHFH
jgi:thiamine-monophosphate kinase